MPLLDCQDAIDLIRSVMPSPAAGPAAEYVPLEAAAGRVLAKSIHADRDQPPFPRSARDGYAVRASDGAGRTVRGSVRAGQMWDGPPVEHGDAIEIMTGAPVPHGADAVVMVEHVHRAGDLLTLDAGRIVTAGENVVPQGSEAHMGDTLLLPGTRIGAAEVALLASVGVSSVPVYVRPVVAILPTGDELVPVHAVPLRQQIRNSNSHAVAAMVEADGGTAHMLPTAADTAESLRERIASARGADVLLISGGVSAGRYDLVEDVLLEFGAELLFTGVRIQPGKPAVFGRIPADETHRVQWIFGLPGNPVSAQVTALLFAMPMVRALAGETDAAPRFAQATLSAPVTVKPGLTRFLPARLSAGLHSVMVALSGWGGSGDLRSNARANCYAVIPPDVGMLPADSAVTVLLR